MKLYPATNTAVADRASFMRFQDSDVPARGPIIGRDKPNHTVLMLRVVPQRPTEGRHHVEALQSGEHRRAFHPVAVIRVPNEAGRRDGLLVTHRREQRRSVRLALRGMHRPAHDAATPDIHDQVQRPEHAAHGATG